MLSQWPRVQSRPAGDVLIAVHNNVHAVLHDNNGISDFKSSQVKPYLLSLGVRYHATFHHAVYTIQSLQPINAISSAHTTFMQSMTDSS
jgi:hypothetical protein